MASPVFYKDKQHSHYSNNYTVSDIRSWLNSTFFTTAFSAQERQKIETTNLDNTAYPKKSGEGDPYDFDCSPTDDKIYLLSYKDMLNGQYGFDEDAETHDDNRSADHKYTDYALIQGLTIANDLTSSDNMTSSWMLRTPGIYSQSICYVGWYGELYSEGSACGSLDGIRPALNNKDFVHDLIEFGSYPQSEIKDSTLIAKLNAVSGTWQSYCYYAGTGERDDGKMIASDYMRYKDVTYGGSKYRAVMFDQYRSSWTGGTSSEDYSYQDDNGYTTGTVYWFR